MKLARISSVLALVLLSSPLLASGLATFDARPEGFVGVVLVDGGITFSRLDDGSAPMLGTFTVEDASITLGPLAGFTPPNALAFGGVATGGTAVFGGCKRFEMTTGLVEDFVQLDLFVVGLNGGNSVVVEGFLGATPTGSTSVLLPTAAGFFPVRATLSGVTFDRVVVRVDGSALGGSVFACVDNVLITGAPPAPGVAYCAGDGLDPLVTTACPCGNFGTAGRGCASSMNTTGALLFTTGSIASDSVVLHGSGMPQTALCVFLQGTVSVDAGLVFGDGVRCLSGLILRVSTRANVGGANVFPDATDTMTLSQAGLVTVGGGAVRSYAAWYRNAASFCTPETHDISNGWRLVW